MATVGHSLGVNNYCDVAGHDESPMGTTNVCKTRVQLMSLHPVANPPFNPDMNCTAADGHGVA